MIPRSRFRWVYVFFAVCFGAVLIRLGDIQVRGGGKFHDRARRMHFTRPLEIPAARGVISSRQGRPLALSILTYDLFAEPRLVTAPVETANAIAPLVGVPEEQLAGRLGSGRPFVYLRRGLDYAQWNAVRQLSLGGIGARENYYRFYPEGRTAAHVVGFVEGSTQRGLEGVERYHEGLLAGREGRLSMQRDGRGALIAAQVSGTAPEAGTNLRLTIDLGVQRILEEELERVFDEFQPLSATGVVLDAASGEILGMANMPAYDPNEPGAHAAGHRRNRAITDLHEPGSVFKIITAAAALDEGLVTPGETINCEQGRWTVRNRVLHDVHPYGDLSFREVIAKSSNIGIVKVALRLGEERLHRYAAEFGFGSRSGIDLPGERIGTLRPPAQWSGTSITAIPIGHEVTATALQSAIALAAIVNGGIVHRPRLVATVPENDSPDPEAGDGRRVISAETSRLMTEMLAGCIEPGGTARRAAISGYLVGGKTGTARKIVDGRYSRTRHLASFAGFIKAGGRNLVFFIMVDEPQGRYYGGEVAAPAFRRIGKRTMLALNIPPRGEDNESKGTH